MNDGLIDAFRHNAWATRTLLSFCRDLKQEQLNARAAGVYGTLLETLRHILGGEAYYRFLFMGGFPDWDWREDELPTVGQMVGWAADMAAFWEDLLASPLDAEVMLIRKHENGSLREARIGVVIAQTLHHGNVHREQACSILTSLGLQPPDLQAWSYGTAAGRTSVGPIAQ